MGSQQPPGSPLSREEGEAPPPTPAPEGRRRSRRVRLRGSCRHRPSLLGRGELASSAAAGPAPASSEIMASAAKEFKMDNFSPKAGTSKLQQTVPADASPDSKCPICLDRFDNVSYLDRCLHKFCFRCVQEWSKNKAECPLCKQPFDSIFHSVRAEDDFKEYVLRPSYNGSFATPEVRRFRYRTTMTRERNASVYSPSSTMNRRTTTPPDSGVLFEGLGISSRSRGVEIPQLMRQISLRQSTADERPLRKIQEQDIINFRRTLYRAGARVRNIEDGGRYRDISAEFFRRNPACLHRLVPWLKRELTVLFGAHGSLVNIVQHIIMSNVTRYDLESQAFVSDLRPFLLNRTEHFIHEFISFARSPFNMAAFDQHANYDCPAPSYEEGSHSDSSVITISPDETETQELDINVATVSQAPWDDETPGPSYSSSDQVHVAMSSLLNTSDSSDEELVTEGATSQIQGVQTNEDLNNDSDSSSDNCVIVGFVKPLAERTPELVELSSDSEELGSYEKIETGKTQEQEHSYSTGDSDVSRCSSPRSILGKDEQMNKGHCDSGTRIKSRKEEKRSTSLSSPRDLSSSMRGDRVYSPYNHRHRKRGRSRSSDSRSQSRSGHDQRNHRRHHGKKRMKSKRSRSRESSRPRGRRDKKRSRTRDSSWSRRSQTLSLSSESTSRSRSRSSDHGKRRSRSRNRDRYYLRNNYGSRYKWEYTYYSRNKDRDGYESSYRRRTLSRAHYSRQSSSPEFRIQSFSERTNARKKNNHSERKYYYYERHRSRSLSSNRSRTASTGPDRVRNEKPGGKRKYKTRHLEGTNEVAQPSRDFASKVKDSHYQKSSSKLDGNYKNESDSFSDSRSSERETKPKKRKRRTRSLSVEIVYEGKATDTTKHHKKKKKKHKKKHRKHHGDNISRSPVVITIDSDSDKDSEVKADMEECDNNCPQDPLQNEFLAPSLEPFETKDIVTIEDEFGVLDKECDITTLTNNLNNANKTVANIPPQPTSVEQTLDVREESTFASDLENQPSGVVSIQTEPSRQLPSPRTSLMSLSLHRD
ncbi:E3 ubiquitin-protein ligase Topors isoform X1 [Ictidomys tridecemlineatus]|uniref:E3 ubiquitin-protein ligase Topors isoform X1 n=1 Tax=Ictidomys tridecemlineatus TaxID=43179 RepID=UPI00038C1E8B|nr:E3 ubiquitin-protein ligase Topors isoform X1 [Ictidomys tridecemlineatus]KAG3287364.1 TOP1 binding arginine/serine rich protein [Ictidomys tridecemlineatus]